MSLLWPSSVYLLCHLSHNRALEVTEEAHGYDQRTFFLGHGSPWKGLLSSRLDFRRGRGPRKSLVLRTPSFNDGNLRVVSHRRRQMMPFGIFVLRHGEFRGSFRGGRTSDGEVPQVGKYLKDSERKVRRSPG